MKKITNKKRFCGTVAAAVMVTACLSVAVAKDEKQPEFSNYEAYTVKPGDTLWSIAAEHCHKGTDKRRYIFEIANNNQIEGNLICPGDKIMLKIDEK